jgi:hypothetical protein
MQPPINPNRDRDMTEYIYAALRALPEQIGTIEFDGAMLANALRESKANLEDAELNATLNAEMPEKSNADSRKTIIAAALAKDPNVKKFRSEVMRIEGEIETNEAEAKTKRREFQAALALAELHAARINSMYRYQTLQQQNERDKAK